ncbi:MAG: VUT family protein [Gammaproteobacteria bacterium]
MNKEPSFKIAAGVVSLYVLCLFIPTFDIVATYKINLYFFSLPFGVAAFIFPAIYPLADSITEVYGKRLSYYLVLTCYIVVIVFSSINNALLSQSKDHALYSFMLGTSVLITIVGPISYFTTAIFNITFLNRLKIKMRGKHFIFRSLICSGISEIIMSAVIYPIVFYHQGMKYALMLGLGTCIVKILITIPMVFVAKFLVILYRYIDGIEFSPYSESLAEFSKINS